MGDELSRSTAGLTMQILARPCRALEATDGLGKAVEALRQAGLSALPVVAAGRLLGMVSEGDIMRLLSQEAARGNIEGLRTTPVSRAMTAPIVVMYGGQTVEQARDLFASSDLRVLPVVDASGVFQGIVTRADVMSALFGVTTPPRVGGLATPLGVFLSTGSVRGGAGDLGLFLTGASLVMMFLAASFLTNLATLVLEKWFGWPLFALSVARETLANQAYAGPSIAGLAGVALMALQLAIFFILLRLAPLTGTHAAEHMVVHAIEEGDELTLEQVATKPRVHPRCGTNLMALVFIALAGGSLIMSMESYLGAIGSVTGLALLLIVIYLVWRGVGAGIQRFLTTKPPSRRQIESAIRAARQLLSRYQQRPSYRPHNLAKLWNVGIIQVAAGFITTWSAAAYLSDWLHLGLFPFGRF
jgi:predicted transcriptional regulator